jgi:hypothetical protein
MHPMHPPVHLSYAVAGGVLVANALCFSLAFFGGSLWARDSAAARWLGGVSLGGSALGFGVTWLWLFGWL